MVKHYKNSQLLITRQIRLVLVQNPNLNHRLHPKTIKSQLISKIKTANSRYKLKRHPKSKMTTSQKKKKKIKTEKKIRN